MYEYALHVFLSACACEKGKKAKGFGERRLLKMFCIFVKGTDLSLHVMCLSASLSLSNLFDRCGVDSDNTLLLRVERYYHLHKHTLRKQALIQPSDIYILYFVFCFLKFCCFSGGGRGAFSNWIMSWTLGERWRGLGLASYSLIWGIHHVW